MVLFLEIHQNIPNKGDGNCEKLSLYIVNEFIFKRTYPTYHTADVFLQTPFSQHAKRQRTHDLDSASPVVKK